jgi:hypothetical protein
MTQIVKERLPYIEAIKLESGGHDAPDNGLNLLLVERMIEA